MEEIKGKVNVFKFLGTFDKETGSFDTTLPHSLEEDLNDFIFWLEKDGTLYVETSQKWEYDDETGSFYLLREVK